MAIHSSSTQSVRLCVSIVFVMSIDVVDMEAAPLVETRESPHGGVVHGNGAGVSLNPPMRKTILLK